MIDHIANVRKLLSDDWHAWHRERTELYVCRLDDNDSELIVPCMQILQDRYLFNYFDSSRLEEIQKKAKHKLNWDVAGKFFYSNSLLKG